MRVGELIEKLKTLDPNLLVVVDHDDYGDYVEAAEPKVLMAYSVDGLTPSGRTEVTYEASVRKNQEGLISIVHLGQGSPSA